MKKHCMYAIAVLLVTASVASAGRVWHIRPVEIVDEYGSPHLLSSDHCAIAMRTGQTWPSLGYTANGSSVNTATMTPVGWVAGIGTGTMGTPQVQGAAAGDGTVAFAYANGLVKALTPGGWSTSAFGPSDPSRRPGIDFNSDNTASILYSDADNYGDLTLARQTSYGWLPDVVGNTAHSDFGANLFDVAIDSLDQAVVVFDDGNLWAGFKGGLSNNQWLFTPLPRPFGITGIDVAIGRGDKPYAFLSSSDANLYFTVYEPMLASWATPTLIDSVSFGSASPQFSAASDNAGGVGVAYVDGAGNLNFAYNDGISAAWQSDTGIAAAGGDDISLAFDYADFPVICYADTYGDRQLAYDPVVPEPTATLLMLVGCLAIRRRRS